MSTNELIQRRAAMMQFRGGGTDWESIARGMLDCTTAFSVPSDFQVAASTYLFAGRTGLKNVTITGSLIGANCFDGCAGLSAIDIPDTIAQISTYAFRNCTGLTTITIPASVHTIAYRCFQGCTNLTEVIMERATPPTLQESFYGCTALESIYVPDASVSAYQSASSWSTYASIIKGISERPT